MDKVCDEAIDLQNAIKEERRFMSTWEDRLTVIDWACEQCADEIFNRTDRLAELQHLVRQRMQFIEVIGELHDGLVATQMRLADKQAELRHLERDVTRRERELTVKDAEVDRCGAELEELRELFNMP